MQKPPEPQTTVRERLRSVARVLGNITMFAGVEHYLPMVSWWIDLAVCLVVAAVVSWGWTGRWFA